VADPFLDDRHKSTACAYCPALPMVLVASLLGKVQSMVGYVKQEYRCLLQFCKSELVCGTQDWAYALFVVCRSVASLGLWGGTCHTSFHMQTSAVRCKTSKGSYKT
jgi:hypothetical protein